ncbi:HAD family hydrolase [Actinopolymorpha alba]|uniref:HAD family hydrolase n=1 Tax=Actinopolymorpha alba TaxID=533267 RepID=UPI000363F9EC|nr:HAD family hydrolase [Actinopolymorpha alba]
MVYNCPTLHLDRIDAVVFDTDDVVVDTARLHSAAWKRTFDDFLHRHGEHTGVLLPPFEPPADYLRAADGQSGIEGVRRFLSNRGISIPEFSTDPAAETVQSLAATKDAWFLEEVRRLRITPYPSTVELLRELRARGTRTAAVSESRNSSQVLAAAGVADLFDVQVDGVDAAVLGLPSRPDPALLLEATRRLGVSPRRSAALTSSLAGVEAAWSGCFEPIMGVDRHGEKSNLYRLGAHVVVADLAELTVSGERQPQVLTHR